MKDTQLYDLKRILTGIFFNLDLYTIKPSDIRPFIKKIKEEVNKKLKKNVTNFYANIDINKL
jgi:hypothetical protein